MFITTNKLKENKNVIDDNYKRIVDKIYKSVKKTDDFILYKNFNDEDYKNKEKVIILTSNFNLNYIKLLANIINSTMTEFSSYEYFVIINAYNIDMPLDIFDKSYIIKNIDISTFSKICSNFEKVNKEIFNSKDKVITLGNALYSITQNSTITHIDFQETPFCYPFFITNRFTNNPQGIKVYPLSQDITRIIYESAENKLFAISDNALEIKDRLKIIFKDIFSIREYPPIEKVIIKTEKELEDIINQYSSNDYKYIAWDTETSSLTCWKADLGCITFCLNGIVGYYLPYSIIKNNNRLLEKFNNFINSKISILANGKYDLKILSYHNFKNLRIDNDVIALSRILDNERHNGLKPLSYYYTNLGGYDDELDKYKEENKIENYLDISQTILSQYAIIDSIVTYRAYFNLLDHLRLLDTKLPNDLYYKTKEDKYLIAEDNYKYLERSQEYNYRNLYIPTVNNFVDMELRGIYINIDLHKKMCNDLILLIQQNYKKFNDSIGLTEYNEKHSEKYESTSPTQLAQYLEKVAGWECVERTKVGYYKLSDDILETYKQTHPEIKYLQNARTLSTIYGLCAGSYDNNNINNISLSVLDNEIKEKDNERISFEDIKGWVPYINVNHKDYETDIFYITQNNKTYKLLKDQIVKTNNGKKLAQDLTEEDILII